MQRDLHFNATLALCVRAGYSKEDAKLIAWSNYQCDCTPLTQLKWPWQMWLNNPGPYFHFVEGQSQVIGNASGIYVTLKLISGVVQANSPRMREYITMLCEYTSISKTEPSWLIRLGIALHAFQDSYSHAGFVGRLSKRNVMGLGRGYWLFPPYGHAQVPQRPDRCEVVWIDTRTGNVRDNKRIFASCLRETYQLIRKPETALDVDEIARICYWPAYDHRKKLWNLEAGMPDLRFSNIQAEYWREYKKQFKAAAARQRAFLKG